MRWLLHGKLSPAVAEALRRHEHVVQTVSDLELDADTAPIDVLSEADKRQLDIVTNDAGISNAIYEGAARFRRCIVYLQLPGDEVEQDDAIDRLFVRYKRLSSGKLYTVTATRVKVRQLPTT